MLLHEPVHPVRSADGAAALEAPAAMRRTTPADTPVLQALANETGSFRPLEICTLGEVLNDYHHFAQELGHRAVTYERHGQVLGFAYYAPEEMTDRTWKLWWIVVRKNCQGQGIGGLLLRYLEEDIRREQGRILFIETSSLATYEATRQFYRKHDYEESGTLADYYAEGDGLVCFRKKL